MTYTKKIGFIGLGAMGKHMATNLAKKGFQPGVFDIRPEPVRDLVALGAVAMGSPKEIGEKSDVIISMVSDSAQTDSVLDGEKGLWQGIRKGAILIISSTVDPLYCQKIEQQAKERGARMMDAPVSGGSSGAEAGTLSLMVGGEKTLFDECLPIFEAVGKQIFHVGGVGSGETMKLVNNLMSIINQATASEAIALGMKAGLNLDRMLEIIKVSSGASRATDRWHTLAAYRRQRKEQGAGMHYGKDLNLAIRLANSLGRNMPIAALVSQLDTSQWLPEDSSAV